MTAEAFADPTTATIIGFLRDIGIPVYIEALTEPTFVPGILLRQGALVVDIERLRFPGDLLHEAGHVAASSPYAKVASRHMNGSVLWQRLRRSFHRLIPLSNSQGLGGISDGNNG